MKILLKDIPAAGLNLDRTVGCGEIGLPEDGFKCLTPLHVKARIEKASDAVLAKAQIQAGYEFPCARCLEPVKQDRADRFDLYFEITPETESIDLTEDIRQELIITLSTIILCRDDCRGMCPDCGVNLNNQECRCDGRQTKAEGLFNRAGKAPNIP